MSIFSIVKHVLLLGILGLFLNNLKIEFTPFQISHLIISIVVLEYYAYVFHKSLFANQKKKKELKQRIENETQIIETFLDDELHYFNSSKLLEMIEKIEDYTFYYQIIRKYDTQIAKKMVLAKRLLEKLNYEEEITNLVAKKNEVTKELQELEYDRLNQTQTSEEETEQIKERMELEENPVFYKEDLSEEELDILKNEGYEQSNEYSVTSKKVSTFLIRKVMNHSKSHTFLVWNIMELLYDLDMDKITEHKTIDADITFKYKNRIYAIEVETGTLLKKKKQTQDKIDYLNKKYKDRWLIVVSNRDYLKKYKKLGFSTQRKQVEKTLNKWLKLDI